MYVCMYVCTHTYVSITLRYVAVTSRRNAASMMRIRRASKHDRKVLPIVAYLDIAKFKHNFAIFAFPLCFQVEIRPICTASRPD